MNQPLSRRKEAAGEGSHSQASLVIFRMKLFLHSLSTTKFSLLEEKRKLGIIQQSDSRCSNHNNGACGNILRCGFEVSNPSPHVCVCVCVSAIPYLQKLNKEK